MQTAEHRRLAYPLSEAGQLLGMGREAARKAAQRGHLPTVRIGSKRYVTAAQLAQLLDAGDAEEGEAQAAVRE